MVRTPAISDEVDDGAVGPVVEGLPLLHEGLLQPFVGVDHQHPLQAQLHAHQTAVLLR